MKNYFREDYKSWSEDAGIKKKYDEADEIFERRIETGSSAKGKADALNELIKDVKKTYENSKIKSLTLGNAYLRLAQCQNELMEAAQESYKAGLAYLEEHIEFTELGEIDLLLMLNKGKYFRNTAVVGKTNDYDRAKTIFEEVEKNVKKVDISAEKRFHLLLDAKINRARVMRYGYDYDGAYEVFLSIASMLQGYVEAEKREKAAACSALRWEDAKEDAEVKQYGDNTEENLRKTYSWEYFLQALIHIGIIYRKNRDYQKAVKIFKMIGEIDAGNIDAKNNLGVCYRKLGDINGGDTVKGKEYYEKAKKIFDDLSGLGNKFAIIHKYKCMLNMNDEECQNAITELEKECEEKNNAHFLLVLGRCYKKTEQYEKAMKCFDKVYGRNAYVSHGGLGFKAYYNLAQCKIRKREFRKARDILETIREQLKKNSNMIDVLTEIDYGWCLMKIGNYGRAREIYEQILTKEKTNEIAKIEQKQYLETHNNLAECHIHLGDRNKARKHIQNVTRKDPANKRAMYLEARITLTELLEADRKEITKDEEIYRKCYESFKQLRLERAIPEDSNSGWMLSALLYYKKTKKPEIRENIINKIKYSTDAISMKCLFYLAEFILQEREENDTGIPYRDFCHIRLNENVENNMFRELMETVEFRYIPRKDRACILAKLVCMYRYVLNIKNKCRYTCKGGEVERSMLPYHYTKLNTLKILLKQEDKQPAKLNTVKTPEDKPPKLRLWNSVYMNDTYEGCVFNQMLHEAMKDSKKIGAESLSPIEEYLGKTVDSTAKTDSDIYITSFSKAQDSFAMWYVYGQHEKGAAIKFDESFFDIKNEYVDTIMDDEMNEYALYEVQYLSENGKKDDELMENTKGIVETVADIEKMLISLEQVEGRTREAHVSALAKVRAFITGRINEVRFLFKASDYQFEDELRMIRCSAKPEIDDQNFKIPRLYIEVDREIKNLEIRLGSRLETQQLKDMIIWLRNTGKVREVEVSCLNRS